MSNKASISSLLVSLIGLSLSCQVATGAETAPAVEAGVQWEEYKTPELGPATLTNDFPDREWWQGFRDPYLEQYIRAALANNPTLAVAIQRITEARAQVNINISKQLPVANLSGSFYNIGLPDSLSDSLGGGGGDRGGGFSLPDSIKLFNVPFSASYEVDLFGRRLDQTRATRRILEATQQDARAAEISLTGEVAAAYFNLLRADALVDLQARNLALLTRVHELKVSQNKIGLAPFDEVIRADRDVAQTQQNIGELKKDQAVFAHQLSILTGSPPASQEKLPRALPEALYLPETAQTGTPPEMLARRPDILAAERRLEGARLNVRAARKAYLPTINLSAGLFMAGSKFSDIFKWDNAVSMQTVGVSQPLTGLYEVTANVKIAKSRQKQQVEDYRRVTLNALKEVEDNIAILRADYQTLEASRRRQALTVRELGLTENLYQQGLVPYLNVLQGQGELLQYDQQVVQSRMNAAVATVNLYKALGGGF